MRCRDAAGARIRLLSPSPRSSSVCALVPRSSSQPFRLTRQPVTALPGPSRRTAVGFWDCCSSPHQRFQLLHYTSNLRQGGKAHLHEALLKRGPLTRAHRQHRAPPAPCRAAVAAYSSAAFSCLAAEAHSHFILHAHALKFCQRINSCPAAGAARLMARCLHRTWWH